MRVNNENLTREEAYERSTHISVDTYDVHIDLTNAGDQSFASFPTTTTVKFTATPGTSTFIDYIHHSIDAIQLNGKHLGTTTAVEGSRIRLENLEAENTLTIQGNSYYSRSGEGLHRFFDPSDGKVYLYTQYEPADCRRVFPVFEQPDLKAVFSFRITAPKHWIVSSNAALVKTIEDPSDSNITKRVFAPTEKISTYITAILAGEYFVATDTYTPQSTVNSGEVPLVAYCRQSLKDYFDYQDIFDVTKRGLDFFQDLFDYPYPFHKYEQAFVPEYNLGAMENPGLVTFTESYLFESGATTAQLESRANVICHEMAHMWFGDLVTMKWWSDLWLKESFADYMGTLGALEAANYSDSWVTFANRRKAWAYHQDQMPTTHPIVADIPHLEAARQNFDGITYAKGASALKQLVAYVGFDTFIDATRRYFKKHAYGNTTLDDFIQVLDDASDRDIRHWAEAWLMTSGLSTLTTERIYNQDGSFKELRIQQILPEQMPASTGRPHQLKLETFKLDGDVLVSTSLTDIEYPAGDVAEITVEAEESQLAHIGDADLLVLNAEDLTYAKVYLQEADGQELAFSHVSSIEDALTRGLMWGSLWNQVRDARLSTEKFVQAVEHNLTLEPSATLLSSILTQAHSAINVYTAPERRKELRDSFYRSLSVALPQLTPGSDEQLIVLRTMLALAAETDLGLELAQEVSQGATESATADIESAPGIKHNQTLGWSALIALAAHKKVDAATLESAYRVKETATAERGYAFARAALPTAEAKQAAFEAVLKDKELSNDLLTATAQGFQQSAPELREPYQAEFFDALTTVWDERSIGMAGRIIEGLFPQAFRIAGTAPEQHPLIKTVDSWLAEHQDAPSALLRVILEQRENTLRSLTAQDFNS